MEAKGAVVARSRQEYARAREGLGRAGEELTRAKEELAGIGRTLTGAGRELSRAGGEMRSPLWRHHIPLAIIGLLVAFWLREFLPLVVAQQRNHATFDYDLGIFDQTAWLLSRGQGFITLRGLPVLGHHLNVGLLLFAPFYWLGAGAEFLNIAMTLALASCVIPITLICRRYRPNTSWYALAFSFAFLFNPLTQDRLPEMFYPETMAVPFMLGAIWAAMEKRWRLFIVLTVGTIIWKEDLALFVMMLGLGIAVKRDRRIGLWTAGAGLAYFVIATRVVLAHFAGGDAFYAGFLGPLGDSPFALAHNLVTEPSLFSDKYNQNDGTGYVVGLTRQWLFTPLVSPSSMLLALPAFFVNIFSSQGYTQELYRHYVVVPYVATVLSAMRGALSRSTPAIRAGLAVGIVALSVWTHNAGSGRWSSRYETGIWSGKDRAPHDDTIDEALRLVPGDASVSASPRLAPQLTRRSQIYSFPNPWHPYNWGINDQNAPAPTTVNWIVVERGFNSPPTEIGTKGEALLDRITTSPCFKVEFDRDRLVVARRLSTGCGI